MMFMVIPPYLTYAEHAELLFLWTFIHPMAEMAAA